LKKSYIFYTVLTVTALFLGYLLIHSPNIQHAPHLDDLNSGGFRDAVFALVLAGLVLFLAAGLGRILLRPFKLGDWSFIERAVISLPLGLATIGYAEFFMGLLGWLKPIHHTILLVIFTIFAFKNSVEVLTEGLSHIKRFPEIWLGFSFIKKFFFTAGALALMLAFLQTLTPPWDYDGLMYHLQGPRLFLDAGKITPIPENWFTFYPATWEMVFMLGLGLGNDIFSRIIHFSTLVLILFATYAFNKRFVPSMDGWLPTAILMGIPMLLVWGTFAYTDLAWALFQFLAMVLVLVWHQQQRNQFLILAGVFQGLALASKYLSISGVAILGFILFILNFIDKKTHRWKRSVLHPILFGISCLFIASPWYIKNLLWTGNPVFPYYLPQKIVDPLELSLFMQYVGSFGTGKEWYDYALLPFNLFSNHINFGTFIGNMDLPNPLFLLVLAYPFFRHKLTRTPRITTDLFTIILFLFFVSWAAGSQQTRFLVPLYPGLAILSAVVIQCMQKKQNGIKLDRIIKVGATGGMMIVSLIIMCRLTIIVKPYLVITNLASKNALLSFLVNDYSAIKFVNERLPKNARVFMPWDGRGYYCLPRKCLPDVDQNTWTALVRRPAGMGEINKWLADNQITHLVISQTDVDFFVFGHDPYGYHSIANETLIKFISLNNSSLVFKDKNVSIYNIGSGK
jgi:hypothetical protein